MGRKISNNKRSLIQIKDQIIGAYQGGGSLKQVAEWFNAPVSAIRTLLAEEDVKLRPQGRRKKVNDD